MYDSAYFVTTHRLLLSNVQPCCKTERCDRRSLFPIFSPPSSHHALDEMALLTDNHFGRIGSGNNHVCTTLHSVDLSESKMAHKNA